MGALSHKAVAKAAGLGWIDKTWGEGKICYNCMLACPYRRIKDKRINKESA